jgi:hypothetical protein
MPEINALAVARDSLAGFRRHRTAFVRGESPADWMAWAERLSIALGDLVGALDRAGAQPQPEPGAGQ